MKKLLIAAIALMVSLASCQNTQSTVNQTANAPQEGTQQYTPATGSVAYINVDSLLMEYNRAIDMSEAFKVKYNKAERELTTKMQRLEKEVMDFQDKVQKGLITSRMAQDQQQQLMQKEQQLMQDRDARLAELSEEEQVMNNTIYHALMDYLKEYNADYKYDMIISTTSSGPLLHANPALSITREVLADLNAAYAAEKTASRKK